MPKSILHIETNAGEPVAAGEIQIIPVSRSVRIQPGKWPVGLIWNRPLAVRALLANGEELEAPVRDVTRQAQVLILASGLVVSLLIWLASRRWRAG